MVGARGKFFQRQSFAELEKQIREDLPTSRVEVFDANDNIICDGVFGVAPQVPISPDKLPLRVKVTASVKGLSTAKAAVETVKQQQIVQLVGNEEMVFEFDEASERLRPVTPQGTMRLDKAQRIQLPLNTFNPEIDKLRKENLHDVFVMADFGYDAAAPDPKKLKLSIQLKESSNQYCTPLPTMVFGQLVPKSAPNQDFLIADFKVLRHANLDTANKYYYPDIWLPEHPWLKTRSKQPVPAKLTLWMTFDRVDFRRKSYVERSRDHNSGQRDHRSQERSGQCSYHRLHL